MRRVLFAVVLAGCVRAPAPLDVGAMVKAKGAVAARQDLEVRVLDRPRDVQLHLALARLADDAGRPAQALAELETVLRIGGPLGTRWHPEDQARFARLLVARGRARLARGAASALDDLERAKRHGAVVERGELDRARALVGLAQLRHVDARERAAGQQAIAELAQSPIADPSWLGAKPHPVPRDRGAFGVWLWRQGAKRAALEALRDWETTTSVKGGPFHDAYLRALAWWTPSDLPPPAGTDLSGPERCRFAGACTAADALADPAAAEALVAAPIANADDDAAAWLALTLGPALRGQAGWGASVAAHVDLSAISLAALPPYARAAAAALTGRRESGVSDADLAGLPPHARLVAAAGRALDGAGPARVRAALGPLEGSPEGVALLRILDPAPPAPFIDPFTAALTAYLRVRHLDGIPVPALLASYRANAAHADHASADAVAQSPDAALALASLGAFYDAVLDPARSRASWQAAVALSAEPAFVAGLAIAMARANDPDAAMINATSAAAASGDPAVVWLAVARALDGVGQHVHALEAARSAIDLAGPDAIAPALDIAIAASRALGRDEQVMALTERRRHLPAPVHVARAVDDPTDAASAIESHRQMPGVVNVARMWIASRWNPRDVEVRAALLDSIAPDDPRRTTIVSELVALAADRDPAVGRAALDALR